MNTTQWATESRQTAANPQHEWDRRALDWPALTPDSIVLEIGAYKGRWALQIAERYNPRLYCFEPQAWACATTKQVLEDYNAQVFNYALGDRDDVLTMGKYGTDGCSFVDVDGQQGNGVMRDIAAVLPELGITAVDLCLINIEGYEFTLLPYMFRMGIYPNIFMVQMHGEGQGKLRKRIARHYRPLWYYGGVLSAWCLKGETNGNKNGDSV